MNRKQQIENIKNTIRSYFCFYDKKWEKDKNVEYVRARNILAYILRTDFNMSYSQIGEIISKKSKSAGIYMYNSVLKDFDNYKEDINNIMQQIIIK